MAGTKRHTPIDLKALFDDAPYQWSFFNAVRRIECVCSELPRIGCALHANEDPVRFGQSTSLAFPPAEIERCVRGEDGGPDWLMVHFLGLLGCNGPMPLHFTEYVHNRGKHHRDYTLAAFLNMFHHRMLCLFYRAWAVNQQTVSFDRGDDPFGGYIAGLIGLGFDSLRDRDDVPDVAKLHYAGRLMCPTAHAAGLQAVLREYFGMPVAIEEFVGQWLEIPEENRCRLGADPSAGRLGISCIAGSRIWDCQQKFRLRFGPMTLASYEGLLPGSDGLGQLVAWVRTYVGLALEWDLQLVLRADEVPATRLGSSGRLGWTTWLNSESPSEDADDLILVDVS